MMGIPIGVVVAGVVEAVPYEAGSLAEAATKEPQGVYTVGRTYTDSKALLLEEHLNRLERSAALEHVTVHLDRAGIRQALRTLLAQSGYETARYRVTVPRETPDRPIISLEAFHGVPQEIVDNGVRVVTVHMSRRNPAAKTTDWMNTRRAAVDTFPPGIYEGILVTDTGLLLEGTNSNFYAIRNDTLRTADENDVLSGIARRIVLTVAPQVLQVQLAPINTGEIPLLSEALLTSSSRGIIPIVEIEGHRVGEGHPGQYTRRLQEAYNAWVDAHLEPI